MLFLGNHLKFRKYLILSDRHFSQVEIVLDTTKIQNSGACICVPGMKLFLNITWWTRRICLLKRTQRPGNKIKEHWSWIWLPWLVAYYYLRNYAYWEGKKWKYYIWWLTICPYLLSGSRTHHVIWDPLSEPPTYNWWQSCCLAFVLHAWPYTCV